MLLAFSGNAIQLVPDGTLLFHLLLVVVMVVVLNATLLKPINRVLEERDRRTKGRLTEAQQLMHQVDTKLRDYELRLRDARSEGYALMEQERARASADREQKLAAVRSQVSEQISQEKQSLSAEAENVKGVLRSDAQNVAADISRQILRRPVSNHPTA